MAADPSSTRSDFYVYALFREDGRVFYIGKGRGRRLADHEMAARRGDRGYRNAVIREMQARGIELIRTKIHDGLTEDVAHAYEIALIAAIGRHPHGPLTNLTDGGEGFVGFKHATGRKQSPEHVAKISAAMRGRKLSPEHIAAMSVSQLGRKATLETRVKMSVKRRGRSRSPEAIAKTAASNRGKKRTPEACANMSLAQRGSAAVRERMVRLAKVNRGRRLSPEHIEKMAATKRGKKHSLAHIAKRMAAHIGKTRSAEARANMAAAQRASALRKRASK